ncbi:serine/threonine-protein kinase RIO1-like [Babylonia areolata]|uniref:serine/threonine-protein kinase RIO1-like n=1 Tax=Babylonia areolata TaxID=304850 RepID=UPI003FD4420A
MTLLPVEPAGNGKLHHCTTLARRNTRSREDRCRDPRNMMASFEDFVPGQFSDADDSSSEGETFEPCPKYKELDESIVNLLGNEDDYDSESDHDDKFFKYYDDEPKVGYNAQQVSTKTASFQPKDKLVNSHKMNFGNAGRSFTISAGKMGGDDVRRKDKANRATTAQVLDQRTMLIINKMLTQGHFDRITGSISVGKEANVFRAEKDTEEGTKFLALKVYKTSILTFKNRSKYVDGDFRLRRAYHGSNPRKMVKTWAEKEMRNLSRIHQAGIPCPQPLLLKGHLFLMTFIGSDDGAAAPLLLNANLSESRLHELYLELVLFMRRLFFDCKLVHADLSEFNILYHGGSAHIIDVSQAVEHDHPNAMVFLRKDCTNITTFFRNKGVATMLVKELFDFVTDLTITEHNMDAVLQAAMEKACSRSHLGMSEQDIIDEEVFKNAYIPRTLDQMTDHEKEWEKQLRGDTEDSHFQTVTGMKRDMTGAQEIPRMLEGKLQLSPSDEQEDSDDNTDEENDDAGSSVGGAEASEKKASTSKRPKDETAEEKRERKQAVKEARKEKQKTKIKKHEKKRAVKKHLSKK